MFIVCLILIAAPLLLWSPFYRWGNRSLEKLSKSYSPQNNHIEFEPKSLRPHSPDSICLVAVSSEHIVRLPCLGFGDMHFLGFLPGPLCGSSSPHGGLNAPVSSSLPWPKPTGFSSRNRPSPVNLNINMHLTPICWHSTIEIFPSRLLPLLSDSYIQLRFLNGISNLTCPKQNFLLCSQEYSTPHFMIPPFKHSNQKCRPGSWFFLSLIWTPSNSMSSTSTHLSSSTAVSLVWATNIPCLNCWNSLLTGFLLSYLPPPAPVHFSLSRLWRLIYESTRAPPLLKTLPRFSYDRSPDFIGCPSRPCVNWLLTNFAAESHTAHCLIHYSVATVVSFQFPSDTELFHASGPLHWQSPLPGMRSPWPTGAHYMLTEQTRIVGCRSYKNKMNNK